MQIQGYLTSLRRRWRWAGAAILISIAASVLLTIYTPPSYSSTAQLFVSTQLGGSDLAQQLYQGGTFSAERVKSYAALATSPRVLRPVEVQFPNSDSSADLASRTTVVVPQDTVLISISVSARSAEQAARLTQGIAVQLAQVVAEVETTPGQATSPVRGTIVTPAEVPPTQDSPSLRLNLLGGILVGLIGGAILAVLVDLRDNRVKDGADLSKTVGAPVLATIPPFSSQSQIDTRNAIQSSVSAMEGFRTLRSNLQFSLVDRKPRSLLVTSAVPGEGKSSASLGLAMALADAGYRVCLLEADLRRPSLGLKTGLSSEVGLTDVLIGQTPLQNALQSYQSNLHDPNQRLKSSESW